MDGSFWIRRTRPEYRRNFGWPSRARSVGVFIGGHHSLFAIYTDQTTDLKETQTRTTRITRTSKTAQPTLLTRTTRTTRNFLQMTPN